MATKKNELFSTSTQAAKLRMTAEYASRRLFATDAGALLLKVGTAVAWNDATGQWAVWDGNGINFQDTIDGFVYGDDIQTSATEEVIGVVMTKGSIHYDDVVAVNVTDGSYGTEAELQGDISIDAFRQKNLTIIGYAGTAE